VGPLRSQAVEPHPERLERSLFKEEPRLLERVELSLFKAVRVREAQQPEGILLSTLGILSPLVHPAISR